MDVRQLILLASCFSLLSLSGCGRDITGSNAELDVVHTGGPDCARSGCHPGFGAAGTVFTNISGVPISGVMVRADNILIGTTDSLGNFYYDGNLSGNYTLMVGSKTRVHPLPEYKGCNGCHRRPNPTGGALGRLY